MFETLTAGLSALGSWGFWGAVILATALSASVGLIPGIGSITVLAISVPFVVFNVQDPVIGIVFLATIGGVSNTLDSIPAVLLGYPSSATQVTFLEGHQLAQQGKAAHTLGAIYAVSMIGGFVGVIALMITIPIIRPFVLEFGFSEIAAMALFGIAMVSVLSRGAMLKGVIAAAFGILLGTSGIHGNTSATRFIFDQAPLAEGLPVIVVSLGAFAFPEILDLTVTGRPVASGSSLSEVNNREVLRGFRYGLRQWKVTIRQSLFGVFMGAIPGIGSSVVDWLAYGFGIAFTKDKSQFGKGSLDGVLFAESAQNSKEAGQAIPTLAVGVPGGLTWVFVLVGMLSYGIAPGPEILRLHADLVITIVVAFAVGNFLVAALGVAMTAQLAKVTLIPYAALAAAIIPISFLAALNALNDWISIIIVLSAAALGLVMKWLGWPRPPLILGFVLGSVIEKNLQSAVSLYGWSGAFVRPITVVLLIILVVTVYLLTVKFTAGNPTADTDSDVPVPSGGAPTGRYALRLPRPTWGPDVWATFAVIAAMGWVMLEIRDLPPRAKEFPQWLAIGIVILSGLVIFRKWTIGDKQGEIMDIGMRSLGVEGALRRSVITAISLAVLIVISVLFGLILGSILFAFYYPWVMMESKRKWISGAITGVVIIVLSIVLFDHFMALWWPDAVIGDPIRGLVQRIIG